MVFSVINENDKGGWMSSNEDILYCNLNKYVAAIYCSVLSLAYCPVILFSYAFLDDWSVLSYIYSGTGNLLQWDIQSGRPLFAVVRYWGYEVIDDLDDLVYLRALTVTTIVIFSYYVFNFIDKREIVSNQIVKITLPLLLCLLPSIQVYAAWSVCFPYMLSILLSGFSYSILHPVGMKTTGVRLLLSIVLLLLSFAIYQPTAMCFLFFVMLDNCINKNKAISFREMFLSSIVISSGMIGSLFLSKILPEWLYGSFFPRSELAGDIQAKMYWFINESLLNAVNNFNITPGVIYTIISITLSVTGFYYISRWRGGVIKVLTFIFLGFISYIPNILVKENWAAYRSLISLEFFFCIIILIGLVFVLKKSGFLNFIMPVLVVIAMASSSYNIINGFVIPQKSELNALAAALSGSVDKSYTGEVMFDIGRPAFGVFTTTQRYDEFGNISLAAPWAVKGMAEYIRMNKSMNFTLSDNIILSSNNQCANQCIIISTGDAMRNSNTNY